MSRHLTTQYFSNNQLKELAAPTEEGDAANKGYVDERTKGVVRTVRVNGTDHTPTNAGTVDLGTIGGGGGHDFAHTANRTVSTNSCSVSFPKDVRGTAMLSASADFSLTLDCDNSADNYVWIKNTGVSEIDVLISAVTYKSNNVTNVYIPSDGISVPAGKVCEIGIVCNADGAFITARNDLSL